MADAYMHRMEKNGIHETVRDMIRAIYRDPVNASSEEKRMRDDSLERLLGSAWETDRIAMRHGDREARKRCTGCTKEEYGRKILEDVYARDPGLRMLVSAMPYKSPESHEPHETAQPRPVAGEAPAVSETPRAPKVPRTPETHQAPEPFLTPETSQARQEVPVTAKEAPVTAQAFPAVKEEYREILSSFERGENDIPSMKDMMNEIRDSGITTFIQNAVAKTKDPTLSEEARRNLMTAVLKASWETEKKRMMYPSDDNRNFHMERMIRDMYKASIHRSWLDAEASGDVPVYMYDGMLEESERAFRPLGLDLKGMIEEQSARECDNVYGTDFAERDIQDFRNFMAKHMAVSELGIRFDGDYYNRKLQELITKGSPYAKGHRWLTGAIAETRLKDVREPDEKSLKMLQEFVKAHPERTYGSAVAGIKVPSIAERVRSAGAVREWCRENMKRRYGTIVREERFDETGIRTQTDSKTGDYAVGYSRKDRAVIIGTSPEAERKLYESWAKDLGVRTDFMDTEKGTIRTVGEDGRDINERTMTPGSRLRINCILLKEGQKILDGEKKMSLGTRNRLSKKLASVRERTASSGEKLPPRESPSPATGKPGRNLNNKKSPYIIR